MSILEDVSKIVVELDFSDWSDSERQSYKRGHMDAKEEFLKLAKIYDDKIKKMEKQISDYGWEETARHAQRTGGWM